MYIYINIYVSISRCIDIHTHRDTEIHTHINRETIRNHSKVLSYFRRLGVNTMAIEKH